MVNKYKRHPKKSVNLRLTPCVLDFYRKMGKGHITGMQAILEGYARDRFENLPDWALKPLPNLGHALITSVVHFDRARTFRLVATGADPNATDPSNRTVLSWAVYLHDIFSVLLLLSAGADPNSPYIIPDTTVLMSASGAHEWNQQIVCALIAAGADLDLQSTPHQKTALMFASERGLQHIAAILLSAGADPNKRDIDGNTALDLAQKYGKAEVVHLMSQTSQVLQKLYDPHGILVRPVHRRSMRNL